MKVCFFGSYDPNYSRNKILIDGLTKNQIKVVHCRSTKSSFITRYWDLLLKYWPLQRNVDIIYVALVGQLNVPLAWILGRVTGKKIIFDMFYSMYDTYVFDRRSTFPGSLRAYSYLWIDKLAATLADIVITDTDAHAAYFCELLGTNREKFRRIFVGGDDTLFKPVHSTTKYPDQVTVEFHGVFTRLHGAEYFVQAAKLLEREKNIRFVLVGSTKNYFEPLKLVKKLRPKTLSYFPQMPVKQLAALVATSDISIGHLGTTRKARSVITNKIFQALACDVAVITGECPAVRELLTDGTNCLLVSMGDANALAVKIKQLAADDRLRHRLAHAGYALARKKLINKQIGRQLLEVIENN